MSEVGNFEEHVFTVDGVGSFTQKDTNFWMTIEPLAKDKCRARRPGCRNHGSLDGGPLLEPKVVVSSKRGIEVVVWSCPENCKNSDNSFYRQPFVTDVDIKLLVKTGVVSETYYRFLRDPTGVIVPPIRGNIASVTYSPPHCQVCKSTLKPKIATKRADGTQFAAWYCEGSCKTDNGDWVKHPFMKDIDLRQLGGEYLQFIKFSKQDSDFSHIAPVQSNWNAVTGVKRKADDGLDAQLLMQQCEDEIAALRASYQKRIDALINIQ